MASTIPVPPKQLFINPPSILILGAGSRGNAYARALQTSTNAIIAAIAEPNGYKRSLFADKFLPRPLNPEQQFSDWRSWVKYETVRRERERAGEKVEKGIDAVFVCVLDEMHEEVLRGIAPLGVHVCCEKPLSTSLEACLNIFGTWKDEHKKRQSQDVQLREPVFGICHVLRYSPHNMLLRDLVVERKVIGDVLSLEHVEPVGWWHFSHSYVRYVIFVSVWWRPFSDLY